MEKIYYQKYKMSSRKVLSKAAAIIFAAGLFSSAALAATVTIDSLTYTTHPDGTALVSDCSSSYTGALTIPGSITAEDPETSETGTYTVTEIGESAFYNCDALTEIIIPNTVTNIANKAMA